MANPAMTAEGFNDAAVIAISHRDAEAFGIIYDRYSAQLYRYVYRRLGPEHAEDVVAETFLAAFRKRRHYDLDRDDARPWLFGIATKEIARRYRAEQARYRALSRIPPFDDESTDGDVAVRVSAQAARAELAEALRRLSKGDRDVLLLIAWSDLTYEEVARTLGIKLGTVRSRLHRARRKLRESLSTAGLANLFEGDR